MKGYQEGNDNYGRRFVIKDGTICEESKTPVEGWKAVQRFNPSTKENITRYIKPYKTVEAFVDKIEFRDTEQRYDQRYVSWELHLSDENGEPATLSINLNSRIASRFMKTAPNIDWTKPVEFRAWLDKSSEPAGTALFIGQDEVTVPQKYTRETPGDCPEPKKTHRGWNFDDQEDFLINEMLNVVVPACEAARIARSGHLPAEKTVGSIAPAQATASESPAQRKYPTSSPAQSAPAQSSPSGGQTPQGGIAPPTIATIMRTAAGKTPPMSDANAVLAFIRECAKQDPALSGATNVQEIKQLTEAQGQAVITNLSYL